MSGYFTSPSISFGPASIEQLGQLGAHRALLVVDPKLSSLPRTAQVREELEKSGASVERLSIEPHEPTLESVESLVGATRSFGPDWIVALGGGSTIDTAKGLWVRFAAPEVPLLTVSPLSELALRSKARFVAVPTTCGSGSESSWTAHFHGPDGQTVEIASRELVPDWALLDPTFLQGLPTEIRTTTAADAVGHALEAAVSAWANPFADAFAAHAIGRALPALSKIARHPEDEDLLGALQESATQAGLAVANSQVGVGHALAYALGSEFRLPHARMVAALLPYEAEFNYPSARDRYQSLAAVLGPSAGQSRSAVSERLRSVWDAAGLPRTLALAGVPEERLRDRMDSIVSRAHASPGVSANPRVPSREELRDLLLAAWAGRPVDF